MLTEVGEVELDVPRDRDGSFEPQIVKKRQRRLSGVDELVISLAAKGLTTGEIAAHFADVYGAEVSRDTISRITDRVLEEMTAWQSRPLDAVYPVIFIDAIQVKIRDGQVANRPVYTVVGVTADGMREILGLWVGDRGEGAKYWHQVLSEISLVPRGSASEVQRRAMTWLSGVKVFTCTAIRTLPGSVAATGGVGQGERVDGAGAGESQEPSALGHRPTRVDHVVDEEDRACKNLVWHDRERAHDVTQLLVAVLHALLLRRVAHLDQGLPVRESEPVGQSLREVRD